MSKTNEELAREVIDFAFKTDTKLADAIRYGMGLVNPPALTDEECRSIAVNYPLTYLFIRCNFPPQEKENEEDLRKNDWGSAR